jgi:GntR family transcriptional regulator
LKDSLYKIYSEKYYRIIEKIEQDLSAISLDEYSKEKLGIKDETVGLKVEGVTFCEGDLILEAEESVYRGDKYRFSVQAIP